MCPLICYVTFQVSMMVKGRQMVSVLNEMHIAAACIGNHDFGNHSISQLSSHIPDFLLGLC